jgi:hypothetical protein
MLTRIVEPGEQGPYRLVRKSSAYRMRQIGNIRGATLVESLVAAGILVLVLSALFAASGRLVSVVRRSDDMADLQRNCAARMDQLRNLGWADVTDPAEIQALLSTPVSNLAVEREVVSAYEASTPMAAPTPSPTPSATPAPSLIPLFTVTKTATGGAAVISFRTGVTSATTIEMRQLNLRVLTEMRSSGKLRQRELSTIISRSAR